MMKLFSQFEQVDRATPFARREEGKISTLVSFFFFVLLLLPSLSYLSKL